MDVEAEGVCVCEEQLNLFPVSVFEVVEHLVHQHFADFQNAKTQIQGLVQKKVALQFLHCHQIGLELLEGMECWRSNGFSEFNGISHETNVSPLTQIHHRAPVHCIVHQFIKIFLCIRSRLPPHL